MDKLNITDTNIQLIDLTQRRNKCITRRKRETFNLTSHRKMGKQSNEIPASLCFLPSDFGNTGGINISNRTCSLNNEINQSLTKLE